VSFVSGTSVGQAVPTVWLRDQIKAAMIAQGAYTFIEDFTDGGGFQNSVLRSNAASNGLGIDFYVIVTANPGGNAVYLNVAEGYTAATHTVTRASGPASASAITLDAQAALPASTGVLRLGTSINSSASCTVPSAGGVFDYWYVVTNNGVFLITRVGTTSYGLYAGAFDTLVATPATNDPYPIVAGSPISIAQNPWPLQSPRHPLRASQSTLWPCNEGSATWTLSAPQVPTGDLFQGGASLASRVALVMGAALASPGNAPSLGYLRGLFKDCLWITVSTGVTTGDTVIVDGHTYFYGGGNSFWIDTQAV
jgi:hypothetical protein